MSAWYVQWGWRSEYFTHGKQMPICQSFTFCEWRGRRGNVALFYNKLRVDPRFQPIIGNAHFSFVHSMGIEKQALYRRQTNACLPIFCFLRAERATRQRRPLLQQVTRRSKLPAHRWKRSFQLGAFSGDGEASTLPTANKCLFANLLLFAGEEGDEATSPSFTTSYEPIQASSPTLEMLISAWCVQWRCKCEHVALGKQMPVCQSFTFCEQKGRQGNVALLYNKLRVDPSFERIDGNGHFSSVRWVGMQMRTIYPRQANTCLPIFYFLQAERATRQRHPLSQLNMRDWCFLHVVGSAHCNIVNAVGMQMEAVYPWQTTTYFPIFSFLWAERGIRGNGALFCNKLRSDSSFQPIAGNAHFSLVRSMGMQMRTVYPRQTNTCLPTFSFVRAERAMRRRHPLLQLKCEDWCFQRVVGSTHCNIANAAGMRIGVVYPRQTNMCLLIFYSLQTERATRQRRPLFQLQKRGMILLACCWKCSLQQSKYSGDANGSGLPTANNYLFADLFLFTRGEVDEATSPSFATRCVAIETSSASLEALIASLLPAFGPVKEATFSMAIRLLNAAE